MNIRHGLIPVRTHEALYTVKKEYYVFTDQLRKMNFDAKTKPCSFSLWITLLRMQILGVCC